MIEEKINEIKVGGDGIPGHNFSLQVEIPYRIIGADYSAQE